MKILTIGYYDDFARFFLSIKKELKREDDNIEFKYLSLHLSGFLYFLVRLHKVSFVSLNVWIKGLTHKSKYKKLAEEKIYKGIDLDKIILYHQKLNPTKELHYKLQAIAYIDSIDALLKKFKPDILILSGDSRMSVEILNIKAKELNIQTYYFEQGPFGTTIFDNKGVNANASIRFKTLDKNVAIEELEKNINNFVSRKKETKFKRNPIYRGSDYIFQFIFSKIALLPPDIEMEKSISVNKTIYNTISKKFNTPKGMNRFLLILQVPFDVNMVYHSPFYQNHFEIVKDIYENLPKNSILIIREHPLYEGRYEEELYEFMQKNNIPLDKKDLYDSIENSSVVIVNNSTVGIEAIAKLKPVVVLGNSYYDRDEICLKLKEQDNIAHLLQSSLTFRVDKYEVYKFLDYFFNEYLIDGHYRDGKIVASKQIVKRIVSDI